jgi:hypothetical protein
VRQEAASIRARGKIMKKFSLGSITWAMVTCLFLCVAIFLASTPAVADPYNFDFNREEGSKISPTESNYTSVTQNDIYDSSVGYGWDAIVEASKAGNPGPGKEDLYIDCHDNKATGGSSTESTFKVNVKESGGLYEVTLYFWDVNTATFSVSVEGNPFLTDYTYTPARTKITKKFLLTEDGDAQLAIHFSATPKNEWFVSGMDINLVPLPASFLLLGSGLLGLGLLGWRRKRS